MRLSIGIKFGFWLALLGAIFTALTGYYIYDRSRTLLIQSSQEKLLTATRVVSQNFSGSMADIAADVQLVASLPEVKQMAQHVARPATAAVPTEQQAQLAEIFASLLATRSEYSQIRLIGNENFGRELVRVDRIAHGNKQWSVVRGDDLQEKSHQPYFYETLHIAPGQLYVSPIGLNKEQGANYGFGKPTLRVATPIHRPDGSPFGIVVIDVNLSDLFERIRTSIPQDLGVVLTNQQGDYLIHPEPAKTFGFDLGRQFRIQDDLPAALSVLNRQSNQVMLEVSSQALGQPSLAALVRVPFGTLSEQRFVILGLYTPIANVLAESQRLGLSVIQLTLLFVAMAMLLALMLARLLAKPLNRMAQVVRQHALGQTLPSLPVTRNDEVGDLAQSFVSMAEQLNQQMHALKAVEAKLHAILDHAPVGIWLTDRDSNYRFVNQTFCDVSGIPEDRFLGTRLPDLLGESTATACKESSQRCLVEQQPVHSRETMVFADGKPHLLDVTKVQLPDGEGGVIGIIGIAIDITERERMESHERSRTQVLELLAGGAPLREALNAIVLSVETWNPSLRCSILTLSQDQQHLYTGAAPSFSAAFNAAIDGLRVGEGVGACGTAAFRDEPVIIDDMQQHPFCADFRELARQEQIGSCWSEPIRSATGKVLGTFAIYQREVVAPSASDIQLVEQTASLAGIAIERSRSADELKLAAMVYQHSSEAMAVTDADNKIIAINPAFTRLTGYETNEVIGRDPKFLSSGHHDAAFFKAMWASLLATGHWQGDIWNRHKNGAVFVEAMTINTIFTDSGAVHRRVALLYDITEKKLSEELIWRQANFDAHTGLPNRRMFHDRLEQEIRKVHRTGLCMALMFIDLDRFKEVNDTFGHDMGDLLLKEAAHRLTYCVRESDTVARMGGDEFTVILGEITDTDGIARIAQSILDKLTEPFQLGSDLGEMVYVSASIGITLCPEDGSTADVLIKNADQAMYAAKNQGRNRYCYFTTAMQKTTQARMRMTADLRNALAGHQFELHYQPIVDLKNGATHKAEALIRWHHPVHGLVRPNEFIPIAEETGLIVDIGNWVFYEAVRQVALWRASYHADFQISINKSPAQFRSEESNHDAWLDHLRELGLPGQSVVIEITESLLLDATASTSRKLLVFRDAGMQVSLDDFGTGYSSLAYLKKFDIDYLKIDQSFVHNLTPESEDMVICEAMIVMAHKLGMQVIAEGIETAQQRDLLAAAGCDFGQGYLFSRPVPAEVFESLLQQTMLLE